MNETETQKKFEDYYLKIKDEPAKYIAFVVAILVLSDGEMSQDETLIHASHLCKRYTREQFEEAERLIASQTERYKGSGQEFFNGVNVKKVVELAEASVAFIRKYFLFPDPNERVANA